MDMADLAEIVGGCVGESGMSQQYRPQTEQKTYENLVVFSDYFEKKPYKKDKNPHQWSEKLTNHAASTGYMGHIFFFSAEKLSSP